ncbi:hypothetical protein LPUS_08342 [Lasallia pustulata]|uniref:Uncharacterized protein n=1 Tax=Lasallia pustulata TaxID=136370 RepID=A0A1W5D587_9LECA|nr:hypothetical protein LPUS_08342 [Lasallia pustulata]
MAVRCFTHPQVRIYGLIIEGASIRCAARPVPIVPHQQLRRASGRLYATNTAIKVEIPSAAYGAMERPAPQGRTKVDVRSPPIPKELRELADIAHLVLQDPSLPNDGFVLALLKGCEGYATTLAEASNPRGKATKQENSPASTLLSLDEQAAGAENQTEPERTRLLALSIRDRAAERLSTLAHSILSHPNVFITPKLLATYVHTQSLLNRPETLPQAFQLYANKLVPEPDTNPIEYTTPNPKKASSAVPLAVAKEALTAAISAKNLAISLAIIDTTVSTPAYHRSKLIRRALLPIAGLALAPLAAYALATRVSVFQDTLDPALATNIAFAGIISYVGFTATIGYVALTTSNDQMDRVTWATGTPLRERWLREDERAAVDRVAGAWGFKERGKRGEEEGEEWEALREWVGLRGMVLDRTELMDGME